MKNKECHLYIYSDSCFSGKWCEDKKLSKQKDITVVTSCKSNVTSTGYQGGLLLKFLFEED